MFLLLNQGILLFFFCCCWGSSWPVAAEGDNAIGPAAQLATRSGSAFFVGAFFFFSFLFWFVLLDSFLFLFVFFALEPGRNERESAREVRSSSSVWIWCISPEKKKFFLVWKSILWRFFFKWMNEWQRTMSNLFLSIRSHQSIHFNYFFNVSLPIWIH